MNTCKEQLKTALDSAVHQMDTIQLHSMTKEETMALRDELQDIEKLLSLAQERVRDISRIVGSRARLIQLTT